MSEISSKTLRELLRYEPETGLLFWLPRGLHLFSDGKRGVTAEVAQRRWNSRMAGCEALAADCNGYKHGRIFGEKQFAHRVIWAMVHGEWPDSQIDHINGNKSDNRIANLRLVAPVENSRNCPVRSDNKSGTTGVRETPSNRWAARIGVGGQDVYLGVFDDKSAAIAARKAAERRFGFHQNHGRAVT